MPLKRSFLLYFEKPVPLFPLADSLLAITPKVFVVGSDIYADFSETLHLWRNSSCVLQKVELLLESLKISCSWVFTQNLAWAKVLCIHKKNIFLNEEDKELVLSLPVEAFIQLGNPLNLAIQNSKRQDLVSFLRKLGLCFVSDFLNLPLESLTYRFGSLALELVESLKGTLSISLPLYTPQGSLFFSLPAEQVESADSLLYGLESFFPEIRCRLEGRQAFIHTLDLRFKSEDKTTFSQVISPDELTRDLFSLKPVLKNHLNQLSLSAPLSEVSLIISETLSKPPAQLNLLDKTENQAEEIELFIKRMKNKWGDSQVGFPKVLFDYFPEKSWALTFPFETQSFDYPLRKRPLFLLSNPIPFCPQGYQLEELEVIHGAWWEKPIHRQYFLAKRCNKERLWIFQDLINNEWYCHGSFD